MNDQSRAFARVLSRTACGSKAAAEALTVHRRLLLHWLQIGLCPAPVCEACNALHARHALLDAQVPVVLQERQW
jgi:hypothetical protein